MQRKPLDSLAVSSKVEGCDKFAVVLLKSNGDQQITTTSSRWEMDQLQKMEKYLPVKVKLERGNKYFTFS